MAEVEPYRRIDCSANRELLFTCSSQRIADNQGTSGDDAISESRLAMLANSAQNCVSRTVSDIAILSLLGTLVLVIFGRHPNQKKELGDEEATLSVYL